MLKLDPDDSFDELSYICSTDNVYRDDIAARYIGQIFPKLDFGKWLNVISSQIPRGKVLSFGRAADCLGEARAAISVRTCSRDEGITNKHRLVYSDGRVPDENIEQLSEELELLQKGGNGWFVKDPGAMTEAVIRHPPFASLSMDQENIGEMLRDDNTVIRNLVGIDISSKNDVNICSLCRTGMTGEREMTVSFRGKLGIPYVSGFLFFREAPLILPSLKRGQDMGILDDKSLVVMDGNGRLHPRGMGIACQIGAASDLVTAGVAKKQMCGETGTWSRINDKEETAPVIMDNRKIGYASRRMMGSPIYISAGHRTSLENVADIIIGTKRGRIPEPTRWAHEESNRVRRSESPSGNLEVLSLPFHV